LEILDLSLEILKVEIVSCSVELERRRLFEKAELAVLEFIVCLVLPFDRRSQVL